MLPQLLDPRPYFADLPDPRRETRNKLHKLHDILMIVLCAVLSGVEDWVGMEARAIALKIVIIWIFPNIFFDISPKDIGKNNRHLTNF